VSTHPWPDTGPRTPCVECGRPQANAKDWEIAGSDEHDKCCTTHGCGEDLCWSEAANCGSPSRPELRAEIARLTQERDAARAALCCPNYAQGYDHADGCPSMARLREAEAERDALREILGSFSMACEYYLAPARCDTEEPREPFCRRCRARVLLAQIEKGAP